MTAPAPTKPIRTLLVANRGEIAARVIRTARAMAIRTVAVYSDADADLPYVVEADEAVRLPGVAPADTYLRGDLLVAAAERTGADAVHPGYGFLAEHGGFARACAAAGLTFVGPPAHAIDAMGSKLEAKRRMTEAGVPVLPAAAVETAMADDDLRAAADRIGYPLLVKAAFGGGGRGMRSVAGEYELVDAVASAQRESAAAFADGTVFLERLVVAPRHIEVQVLGDTHGNVVHLFERECSIQRRHQKIIEESPSPAVGEALRAELGHAAVAAAKAIGYANAGTVEFVLDDAEQFWFLEVNTRLQVEHPVTEAVTGLDLVALQLRIAQGEAIPQEVVDAAVTGHAIEARLYAEDVPGGFVPVAGRVERLRVPARTGVRVDAGYADGSVVSPHYDAMLAKVIAWAPTRTEASARLAAALDDAEIHGVVTNRELLVGVLRHPDFLAGCTDTGFLERHCADLVGAPGGDAAAVRLHALAATLAASAARRAASPVPHGIPASWRNVGPAHQTVVYDVGGATVAVELCETRRGAAVVDGAAVSLRARAVGPTEVDLEVDGRRAVVRVHRVGDTCYADSALGHHALRERPRFPSMDAAEAAGSLHSPLPGLVRRVAAVAGEPVQAGAVLVVLEAMKMEHTIRAPHGGVVTEVCVAVGDQVETGAVLVVVEEEPA